MIKRALQVKHSNAPIAVPVTVNTNAGGTVIAASNPARLNITLQNVGTEACIIRVGGNPTNAAYNMVLAADTGARKGAGGSITLSDYQGAIKGLTEANSTVIAITEEVSTP